MVDYLIAMNGWNLAPHEKDAIALFRATWIDQALKTKQFKAYKWKVYKTKHMNVCSVSGDSVECQYVQLITMDRATRTNNNRIIP